MTITVRYFASLREALGTDERIAHHAGETLGSIRDALIASDAAHAEALARGRAIRCALNQQILPEDTPVEDGSEVAFFPPVTGG